MVSGRGTRFHAAGSARGEDSAREAALALLRRRPRTAHELREALLGGGHAADHVDEALRALEQAGYVDDEELALHYIVTRSERLGLGRMRLLRELEERGVEPETARRAWDAALRDHGIDPEQLLRRAVRKRVESHAGGLDLRAYRRVYNALLRAGFEPAGIRAELDAYRAFPDSEDGVPDGIDHELP